MWQDSSNEAIVFTETSRLMIPDDDVILAGSEILKMEEDHVYIKIVKVCWFIMPIPLS